MLKHLRTARGIEAIRRSGADSPTALRKGAKWAHAAFGSFS